jgi:hypothetical protein
VDARARSESQARPTSFSRGWSLSMLGMTLGVAQTVVLVQKVEYAYLSMGLIIPSAIPPSH